MQLGLSKIVWRIR